ncbi:GNAT family N-acetyltransferase [Sphingomonas sp. Leaf343]|uniref:GNAT family N-acetyltransferase n=1 Tax=Sphingomonas sp. Leaf343 TaxID=1736345 RepID=UPI0006FEEF78|nr:GNAT family N-acetyltransferase [Sphingomonas sp. Leaf343]KQR84156.1 hypothetical protein ASG07_06090 [Sphingomonas sp. Leaf343]
MAGDDEAAALRDAAAHRGLKLVRSRRRKPGVGDYGLYGLTDAGGKALLGMGDAGLTATADDIRAYLRKAEGSTWAQSAEVTPARIPPRKPAADAGDGEPPATRRRAAGKPRRTTPEKAPEPEPAPEPELVIRAAARADLEAIARLIDPDAVLSADRFDAVRNSGGVLVADRGGVIGCVAWHMIMSLQSAPVGRITMIAVDKAARRQGVGRAMVDAARAALIDRGCESVEAVGVIAVRNVNGFYRAMGFEQQGYRFVREAR